MKSQRFRPYIVTDARLESLVPVADGGYLIRPDGKIAAVNECGHYILMHRYFDGTYHGAYRHGAIRISFCGKSDEFWVELKGDHVTIKALQTLRRLVRHYSAIRPMFELGDESLDRHKVIDRREEGSEKKLLAEIAKLMQRRMQEASDAKRELVPALLP